MKKIYTLLFFFGIINFNYSQINSDVFDIARKGTIDDVKRILKTDFNAFNVINEDGFSPLILACYRGNNDVAKLLIETGSDIDGKSKYGTPLMACIVKRNNELAKLLIEKHADINAEDANGTTALIYAVQFQNGAILKLLIENKADKTHKDKEGKTAFEYAVFSGNEEIINLLK